ncbi:pyridoxal-phosphate dependent enzyme [Candidatus Woesearchaeota archaeon]|nr:pyridoxal-phosphate dependent enzyme [Candidatus Woesearchaeota archaeon]
MVRENIILEPAPIVKSRTIDDFCRKRNVLIKDCSKVRTLDGFSSGTFKDYRSSRLVNDFGERDPVLYSIVYTTAGYSLGNIAREYNQLNGMDGENGVKVMSIIDQRLDERVKRLLAGCSELVEISLSDRIYSREEIREIVLKTVGETERDCIDIENYDLSYNQLAKEVLACSPDYVFMPLGGGEAINSTLNLFQTISKTGRKVPRLIAATIKASVYGGRTQEDSIADKLVTPYSELFPKINRAIGEYGEIIVVEETEIMPTYFALQQCGIKAEPSAAVAFAAAKKINVPENEIVLVVNSGSGIYFDENHTLRGAIWG